MTALRIRPATVGDLPVIRALLESCKLSAADLDDSDMAHFLVLQGADGPFGCAALEPYGNDALLRSVAVAPSIRRAGHGNALLRAIEAHAAHQGMERLYLLTTTAEAFFSRHGYIRTERAAAPAALQNSSQFAGLCPSYSACMVKTISFKLGETVSDKIYNVLFLCTGNSARSVMAEALVTTMGNGRFRGYSAGSHPNGKVNPFAIEQIRPTGYALDQLRSKSWDEFAAPGAPQMDFIITVCDNAAGEVCPVWPGMPVSAHWGFEDPAAVEGPEEVKREAFQKIFRQIGARLQTFVNLPLAMLDKNAIQHEMKTIGESKP